MAETGADGVMSAEGILHNPALFKGVHIPVWTVAKEYIDLTEIYPCSLSTVRGHLFKFFHQCFNLQENFYIRDILAKASSKAQFYQVTEEIKKRYYCDSQDQTISMSSLPVPLYLCQPHFRPLESKFNNGEKKKKSESKEEVENSRKSRKLAKKMNGPGNIREKAKGRGRELCASCPNPKGSKCNFDLCRSCCREKVCKFILDCKGKE